MSTPSPDRVYSIIQTAQALASYPVSVTKIAESWGFEVFTTTLVKQKITGGLFDLQDNRQVIYLEAANTGLQNDLVLAYLLCLWDLLDTTHLNSSKKVLEQPEKYARIDLESLFLENLDQVQQESLKMAVSLLVPDFELAEASRQKQPLSLNQIVLKFGVSWRIAAYALEKNELFLKKSFFDRYNF